MPRAICSDAAELLAATTTPSLVPRKRITRAAKLRAPHAGHAHGPLGGADLARPPLARLWGAWRMQPGAPHSLAAATELVALMSVANS